MGCITFEGGLENTNIKHSLYGSRIRCNQILRGLPVLEAVAVQRDLQVIDEEGFRLARAERKDILGPLEFLRHLAFGVMVAEEQVNRNAGFFKVPHLPAEINTRIVIFPGAVIQVPGDHHEIDLLLDSLRDEISKCFARRVAKHFHWRIAVGAQARQRTIQMNVRSMDEFHLFPFSGLGEANETGQATRKPANFTSIFLPSPQPARRKKITAKIGLLALLQIRLIE